jgi:hypothetical protein
MHGQDAAAVAPDAEEPAQENNSGAGTHELTGTE